VKSNIHTHMHMCTYIHMHTCISVTGKMVHVKIVNGAEENGRGLGI
jgi:hypothetical protein